MTRAFVDYTLRQLKRFVENLHAAMSHGDVEAVHDFRVASRRLNEPLLLIRSELEPRMSDKSRRLLRQLRRAFCEVRDWDVLQLAVRQATPPSEGAAETERLAAFLAERRKEAWEVARRRCRRLSPRKTEDRIQAVCRDLEAISATASADLGEALVRMFRKRAAQLVRTTPRTDDRVDLHEIRIRVKRLRYCAELIVQLKIASLQALITELVTAQGILGRWNDHITAVRTLTRLARQPKILVHETSWSAWLLQEAAARARQARQEQCTILSRWDRLEGVIVAATCDSARGLIADHVAPSLPRLRCEDA